jgi:Fe-S-cluster-containing hydrogenase component 2
MQKILSKHKLKEFLLNLSKSYEVIIPIKDKNTKFEVLTNKNIDLLYLDTITEVPVKEFFLPEKEVLLEFNNGKIIEPKPDKKKRIIFGLRKCDLNALLVLDVVMKDPNYITKRQNTLLIGLFCENPDEYCFCNSMSLVDYYDLFLYPNLENYQISIGSQSGLKLVNELKETKNTIVKEPINKKALKNKDIGLNYNNKIWKGDSEKCLSCSACTIMCPTCNCFDIKDTSNLQNTKGKRIRQQASCQLRSFTQVAGGKIFRDSRLSRFKHFVYHKIDYFKKQHDMYMCIGCGRCLRVCPTKIDWVKTINLLKDSKSMKKQ